VKSPPISARIEPEKFLKTARSRLAELVFDDPLQIGKAKLGILEGSLIVGDLGYWLLRRSLPRVAKSGSC
jgi:hypothetical protein